MDPTPYFHHPGYMHLTDKTIQHLDSLNLIKPNHRVLELGAGIGDISAYLFGEGCDVLVTDARDENLRVVRSRFPLARTMRVDCNLKTGWPGGRFDVVLAYGILYHLHRPDVCLGMAAGLCSKHLIVCSSVSPGTDIDVHHKPEHSNDPSQSFDGKACRPTRPWVFKELKRHFNHVYMTATQPEHPDFPISWPDAPSAPIAGRGMKNHRCVFVASRYELPNDLFLPYIPMEQEVYRR